MATKTLLARPFTLAASRSFIQSPKPVTFPIKLKFLHTVKSSRAAIVSVVCKIRTPEVRFSDGFGFNSDKLIMGRRNFSAGATHVNDSGSIDSPLIQSMEKKIKEELNAEHVSVKDVNGDGRHVSIDVISSSFEGKSAVNRQRMVYKAIWEELQNIVHAVDQMTTRTPIEAGQK